jgi:hypothetical protein
MAEYFFSRHNAEGFSPNPNLIKVLETDYCMPGNSNYDQTKCANIKQQYLEKTNNETTVNAKADDESNRLSYQKMKTWNFALGIAFLGGYLYYKNY